ncbi:hypothetical protein [Trinickia sp.]|uniref:hypothetical protein n=1 Tax=Trinickia sp. TaxID=2571163 RepID=UPI003F7F34C0
MPAGGDDGTRGANIPSLRWIEHDLQNRKQQQAARRRADFEREARISQLDFLMQSPAATPLWERVCMHQMYGEIRARSDGQLLLMELALLEAAR